MRAPRGDIGPIWKPFGATWGGPPAPVSYAAASCFDCHEAFTFDMILAADASPKFVKLPPRRGGNSGWAQAESAGPFCMLSQEQPAETAAEKDDIGTTALTLTDAAECHHHSLPP